jgi:AcrR family transcriptional regulator
VTHPKTPLETATRSQQRRERERETARKVILTAAAALGRSQGWEAVTMRALADRIEYSANFAYRYFASREAILLALVQQGFAKLRDAIAEAGYSGQPGSAADAVRRASHAYLDFALDEPELYQLMYGLGGVRVPATEAWNEGQAVGDVLINLLTAAGDSNPQQHVLQLWALAHGLLALRAAGRIGPDAAALHALLEDALATHLTAQLERIDRSDHE